MIFFGHKPNHFPKTNYVLENHEGDTGYDHKSGMILSPILFQLRFSHPRNADSFNSFGSSGSCPSWRMCDKPSESSSVLQALLWSVADVAARMKAIILTNLLVAQPIYTRKIKAKCFQLRSWYCEPSFQSLLGAHCELEKEFWQWINDIFFSFPKHAGTGLNWRVCRSNAAAVNWKQSRNS